MKTRFITYVINKFQNQARNFHAGREIFFWRKTQAMPRSTFMTDQTDKNYINKAFYFT